MSEVWRHNDDMPSHPAARSLRGACRLLPALFGGDAGGALVGGYITATGPPCSSERHPTELLGPRRSVGLRGRVGQRSLSARFEKTGGDAQGGGGPILFHNAQGGAWSMLLQRRIGIDKAETVEQAAKAAAARRWWKMLAPAGDELVAHTRGRVLYLSLIESGLGRRLMHIAAAAQVARAEDRRLVVGWHPNYH